MNETLKLIAQLMKDLNIGDLEAIRSVAFDMSYRLQQAEKAKFKELF